MKAMLCRIFTAALCVLLLAGCGTKAKTEDLRQSARETRSAGRQDVFDPPGTKRTQVQDRTSPSPSSGRRERRAMRPYGQ